jgi:hypothetical protein
VGVIIFFIVGGFLYKREVGDSRSFWKKKCVRIIIPWMICSTATYIVTIVSGRDLSIGGYLKWIFGSGTWYYYVVIYTLFLALFKWFYDKDIALYCLIGVQCLALAMASFGATPASHGSFFTDYLNPLYWIGYFALGILIRKHRWDFLIRKRRLIIAAVCLGAISAYLLGTYRIFTYFHIITSVFCVSATVIIAAVAYKAATKCWAAHIGRIGTYSYCVYLLHMQIVQGIIKRIPEGVLKLVFSPLIGLGTMIVLISVGLFICGKLPFGEKVKSVVGL